ncbi:MAG TPA: FHA domain-containing protein [Kiritimatiellia bacterium]|nr:FHA domain-containing protein [Kiritimatiellia bacterium]HRZ11350.1 FHA domain-containing protein [Kiritimatiellia bacterium]HSA17099.1 FHA domain-containing protein [Kiritimatiellia bacterium]
MYALHILTGPWKGKRVTVREPSLLIGRDAECPLRLPDDEISRKHVTIEERPDGLHIRDLGSLNGFLVNGQPAREARLQEGSIIELGRTRLQVRLAAAPARPSRRRIGWLQGWTAAAVAALLMGQLVFLLALSMRGVKLLKVVEKTVALSTPAGQPKATVPSAAPPEVGLAPETEPAPPVVSNELSQLRADVEDLRRQVAEATAPAAPAAVEPVPPPPAPAPLPEPAPAPEPTPVEAATPAETVPVSEPAPAPAEDPLVARAKAMLGEAAAEIQKVNLLEADTLLERIQIMAPDFLPAYIERARLYEQRGLLNKAGEQWAIVLQKSIGNPLYEQAAAERIRLARAAAFVPPPSVVPRRREPAPAEPRLPRRVRLASLEQEKLPVTEGYEEMRLLRIAVRAMASERQLDPDDIRVAVTFFDEEYTSKEVVPTTVSVPSSPLPVSGEGSSGGPYAVTATYMVPAGQRAKEEKASGRRFRYHGYAVRVYYREQLQDEGARPKALLEKLRALPSPFHKPSSPAPKPAATNLPAIPAAPAPADPPAPKSEPLDVDAPVGR